MNLYLQNIVNSIQFDNLPQGWQDFDFIKFSDKKKLFDYQQNALKNAVKILYKFYVDLIGDKNKLFELYKNNHLAENLDLSLNSSKISKIYDDFGNDFPIENGKIPFKCFVNRMSFWMATGSGKTLVIVKLIELLAKLIQSKNIPDNEILFLTYREDLIEQFKTHIKEFNSGNNGVIINLYDLKDYEKVKRDNCLTLGNTVNVFYYRSDLISDEQKDKIVNFKNYDNNGKWYILLDEAHKGDREDSKRQHYYSILSRNGFLFNFSATFTDPIDFATCVFNFNLEQFIINGYGKHIYIGKKDDFGEQEKQKIILKTLVLKTYIKKQKAEIGNYYHNPLILTLVNSVNTEDSDLYLFFKELEKIAQGQADENLLAQAKQDLLNDLKGTFEFENEKIDVDINLIQNINYQDILENVFHAKVSGKIEILKIPENRQELVLKLKTTPQPFGLIKIGDISEWIKNKLSGYEINEKFDNESTFRKLNEDDSDINILMGSRSFYEGWDSNRPNIILYINIGKGTDARKFVLQSIGRGVRIEPLPNKRQRIQFLFNNNEITQQEFNDLKRYNKPLETLFVYGTKSENLKEVIETFKQEKQEELIGDLFMKNPEAEGKLLLIPTYKESAKNIADEKSVKFEISQKDFELTKKYFEYIGEKIALVKYDCEPKLLQTLKKSFTQEQDYYKVDGNNVVTLNKPDILIKSILKHLSIRTKEFENFKELENEIIHFKQIRVSKEKRKKPRKRELCEIIHFKQIRVSKELSASLKEEIEKVRDYYKKDEEEKEINELKLCGQIPSDEYNKKISALNEKYKKEVKIRNITIKHLAKHYYLPIVLSDNEKELYLTHIIKTKSEIQFLEELDKYLQHDNNIFKQFDWWFFSKIDETLDEVYIPYYQPKTNRIEKFKPDFIFWLKKGNDYIILFVDPKGTEHTDAYRKIDGYSRIFEKEENGQKVCKTFSSNGFSVKVKLLLKPQEGIIRILDDYNQYWFDNFDDFESKIKAPALTEKTR